MSNEKEFANVWLTARARMVSEARLRRFGGISHILIAYYSVALIASSVLRNYFQNEFLYFNEFNIAMSVVILAATLISYGFHFEENAKAHRECYLKLQDLYSTELQEHEKRQKYMNILNSYPNHSTYDYENMLVREILFYNADIYNTNGKILLTYYNYFGYAVRHLLFLLVVAFLFSIPAVFIFYRIFLS